jgi:SAM-dependent methyltransferase
MKARPFYQLLAPLGAAVSRQLSHPSGWFGRTVMTRWLNRGNRALIEATLEGLELPAGVRLLDVGFGGGLALERSRARGVMWLAGVDPAQGAVDWLRGSSPRWLDGATLTVEQASVEALPFEEGALDIVVSTNTVYFWPDLRRAFVELRRVLRPGGQLALGFSSAAKLRALDAITRHGFHFYEVGELLEHAVGAGFADAQLTELHAPTTEGDWVLRARAQVGV